MRTSGLVYMVLLLSSSWVDCHDLAKRALIFPDTSLYGTFLAIAVPVDIPDKNVFVSYNFEANYSVVTNITEIDEVIFPNLPIVSARHSRSITRALAYTVLETSFKEYMIPSIMLDVTNFDTFPYNGRLNGMNGKECMLRSICEAAETPLYNNGLIGDIMHIIFTPSASKEEGLHEEYYKAELDGRRGDCDDYLDDCPLSIFDMITRLVEMKH